MNGIYPTIRPTESFSRRRVKQLFVSASLFSHGQNAQHRSYLSRWHSPRILGKPGKATAWRFYRVDYVPFGRSIMSGRPKNTMPRYYCAQCHPTSFYIRYIYINISITRYKFRDWWVGPCGTYNFTLEWFKKKMFNHVNFCRTRHVSWRVFFIVLRLVKRQIAPNRRAIIFIWKSAQTECIYYTLFVRPETIRTLL